MINNSINSLLGQMRTLESTATSMPELKQPAQQGGHDFANMMQSAIDSVNQTQQQAAGLKKAFEIGDKSVDLAEVMIAIQKSRVSFTALTEVRNKLLTAYQDVMNMPV